jgi:CzcA family heavy metal efflux pump
MIRWVVGSSLKLRFLVVAGAAALMFFGITDLRHMAVDVFPEFAPPIVEIQTPCLGLSAAEVEEFVSVPLEQALNGVPGLDVMRSKSVSQLSSIELVFKQGADPFQARQLVSERLSIVAPTLPTWASPPFMIPPLSATRRVMMIGMTSKNLNLIQMSTTAYWNVRQRLLRVPGVANVAIWGEQLEQLHVQVDPNRLQGANVSLDKVMEVTADALDAGLLRFSEGGFIGTGGFIETANQQLGVRNVLPIVTPADLAQVPIAVRDGKALRLGDVANLVTDHPPLIGDAVVNGGPGLLLIVDKFPWANAVDVTNGVNAALDQLRPGLPGITFDPTIFRQATFIEMAIHNLANALLLGCLLVVLVLGFFLFEWRSALISLVAIPLSLIGAGFVLYLRGATVNTMVLAGLLIAVGVVVDDAIIDIENIVRRLRQYRKEGTTKSTPAIILEASLEVRSAIIYATLIDVVAIAPILFMSGLSGSFFRPLAISYGLAVLASMLIALTVTPALGLILLRNAPIERRDSPLVRWLQRGYDRVLGRTLTRPLPTYLGVGTVVLIGAMMVPHLGQSLLPDFKERDFLIGWATKPGTSQPETTRIVTQVSHELQSIPGVRSFGGHIGQALLAEEVVGVDFAENWISVDPKADYDETVAAIQKVIDGYPGLQRELLTYLKEKTEEVLTGSGHPIVVRIFGPDLNVLRAKADEVAEALSDVPGLVDLHRELQTDVPEVQVKVNLAAAQRYGLKPGDVRRAASTMVASEEVGDIFRDGKAYDVHVWSTPETRASLTSIRDLPLDTPDGGHVRMGDIADVALLPTPNSIKHENGFRRIDVTADVRGRDLGSVTRQVEQRLGKIHFPLEYHPHVLGEYAERKAVQGRLQIFGLAAALGVFLLLLASFRNWRLALLSFLTLPSALVGGVLAAYAGGGVISLGSLVGFFTVLGIAARNGIMLINHYQHLEQYEGETFGPGLVIRGARERLAPILMTSLATGLALVPLVIAGSIPGHEIEHPMAVVILGGLVTSTLLNLFVVPALYLRFGSRNLPSYRSAGNVPDLA